MTFDNLKVDDRESLEKIFSGKKALFLDFDGPVASVFHEFPASKVATQLRKTIFDSGYSNLPAEVEATNDPFLVFKYSATLKNDLANLVESSLSSYELTAVASAPATLGARELIVRASDFGLKVAIVSNNSRESVDKYLETHELTTFISFVSARTSSDPDLMKPSPHLLVEAVSALGVEASECLLVGDSASDAKAAIAAGVPIVGFANKSGKIKTLSSAGARVLATSMEIISSSFTSPAVDKAAASISVDRRISPAITSTSALDFVSSGVFDSFMREVASMAQAATPMRIIQEQIASIGRIQSREISRIIQSSALASTASFNLHLNEQMRAQMLAPYARMNLQLAEHVNAIYTPFAVEMARTFESIAPYFQNHVRELNRQYYANVASVVRSAHMLNSAHSSYFDSLAPLFGRLSNTIADTAESAGRTIFSAHVDNALAGWQVGVSAAFEEGRRPPEIRRLEHLGEIALGISSGAVLLSDDSEAKSDLEPWQEARARGTSSLIEWLEDVDPKLARKFKGMWHVVGSGGPDWLSQSANSAMELVDWTLRLLGPDKEVLEWLEQNSGYKDEVSEHGKPHRALRVRYIASKNNLSLTATNYAIKAVAGVVKDLQKIKHADKEEYGDSLSYCLVSVEHFLLMIKS